MITSKSCFWGTIVRIEQIRTVVEVVGISALIISLTFVGLELKQNREMDVAAVHFNRMAIFHSKMMAYLESEAAINYYAKHMLTGSDFNYVSEQDAAVAEVLANAQIAEWEVEYRYIEQGFSTRDIETLENEIRSFSAIMPVEAVYNAWWLSGVNDNYTFHTVMTNALDD